MRAPTCTQVPGSAGCSHRSRWIIEGRAAFCDETQQARQPASGLSCCSSSSSSQVHWAQAWGSADGNNMAQRCAGHGLSTVLPWAACLRDFTRKPKCASSHNGGLSHSIIKHRRRWKDFLISWQPATELSSLLPLGRRYFLHSCPTLDWKYPEFWEGGTVAL